MSSPGHLRGIRTTVLLRLTRRGIASHRRRSMITVVVVALAVTAVIGTTGRTEAARLSIVAQLEQPAVRLVRISASLGGSGLSPAAVARLSKLGSVAWVVGLSAAGPLGRNPALGRTREGSAAEAVGTRRYWGDLLGGPLVSTLRGRPPADGEALVGDRAVAALRLADGVGTVEDEDAGPVAVVGSFAAITPVADLGAYVLVRAGDGGGRVSDIVVLIRSSALVDPFVERLPLLLGSDQPVAVEKATELLALREDLTTEVGELDDAVLAASLGTAALLLGAIMYGAIEERRREFGLRRSQGATRSVIAALVVIESTALALAGSVAGSVVGTVVVAWQTGIAPDPALTLAVGALVTLAAIVGSLPAAASAALRQPLYVLRSD